MSGTELLELLTRFLGLSLLGIGGAITVAPEMHRFIVDERGWLTDAQFTGSISLAQASPGPNILFVTLLGWNAGGWSGAVASTVGILLPSSVLALVAGRWIRRLGASPWIRAFHRGMAPITIGLLLATGWLLLAPHADRPALLAVSAATVALTLAARLNPLWMLAGGALVGV
ncbi:MAG: chromate transporter subunit, partial [Pseudomonadota bacterium]